MPASVLAVFPVREQQGGETCKLACRMTTVFAGRHGLLQGWTSQGQSPCSPTPPHWRRIGACIPLGCSSLVKHMTQRYTHSLMGCCLRTLGRQHARAAPTSCAIYTMCDTTRNDMKPAGFSSGQQLCLSCRSWLHTRKVPVGKDLLTGEPSRRGSATA
jgi:hypothetical protein